MSNLEHTIIYVKWHKLFGKHLKKNNIEPELEQVFEDNRLSREQLQGMLVKCSNSSHK